MTTDSTPIRKRHILRDTYSFVPNCWLNVSWPSKITEKEYEDMEEMFRLILKKAKRSIVPQSEIE